MAALTREEKQFRTLMLFWTLLFGLGAVSFLFAGDWILLAGNWAGKNVLQLSAPPMPLPAERFWLSLTTSLMVTITVLSYCVQKDVRANLKLTNLLLVSKLTSTAVFLSAYFWDAPYFNYLLGSVFCDGPIFVITLIFYRRVLVRLTTGKAGSFGSNGGENPDSPPPYPPIGVT